MSDQRANYRHERSVRSFLTSFGIVRPFNNFISISFLGHWDHRGRWYTMTKRDVSDCRNLVEAYSHKLTHKLGYRSRKTYADHQGIPFVGFPEYLDRMGDLTHIHYHCVAEIPPEQQQNFLFHTLAFWGRVKRAYGMKVDVDVRPCYDAAGAIGYALKSMCSEFTVQNMVSSGPLH